MISLITSANSFSYFSLAKRHKLLVIGINICPVEALLVQHQQIGAIQKRPQVIGALFETLETHR